MTPPFVPASVELEQLFLFEGAGPDLRALREMATAFRVRACADATRRAYASDFRDFEAWCRAVGRDPLPASEETVLLYLTHSLQRFKVSTVARRLAAVQDAHRAARAGDFRGARFIRELMAGARRSRGVAVSSKAALSVADLRAVCSRLMRFRSARAVRDRAMLAFGFSLAARRSELVALDLADLRFVARGVVVTIRRSKTDQEGRGRVVGIFHGSKPSTDPVRALRAWLFLRGRRPGPLFPGRGPGGRLLPAAVSQILKRNVLAIGLDPAAYGAHSLRAGFVTAAAELGVPESLIMQRTGHRSVQTVTRYVRPASVFAVDVLAAAM